MEIDNETIIILQKKLSSFLKLQKKNEVFINEEIKLIEDKTNLLEKNFSCHETLNTIFELLKEVNHSFLYELFKLEDEVFLKKFNKKYHQISRYKFSQAKSTEYTKFVILSSPRSGSNYVKDMLSSHSQSNVFSEIFNKDVFYADNAEYSIGESEDLKEERNDDPVKFLNNCIFKKYPDFIKACGFKLFYDNCFTMDSDIVSNHIFSNPEIKFIHLKRRNKLAQYFSYKKAITTNSWYELDDNNEIDEQLINSTQKKLFISKTKFEKYLNELNEQTSLFDSKLSDHKKLDIYYEDLLENQNKTLEIIQSFLHLDKEPLLSTLQKQNKKPLKESIKNYNSFINYLETLEGK